MESHALKYSPGYKAKKGYTFWEKNFDGMAYKTMLRQLISKWGIMSIELQKAFEGDMAVINEDGTKTYVENDDSIIEAEATVEDEKPDEQVEGQKSIDDFPEAMPDNAQDALFGK